MEVKDVKNAADVITADTNIIEAVQAHPEIMQVFAGLWLLVTGRFLNHRSVHPYRTREIEVIEAKHALVGVDGRLLGTPVGSYHISIEQEAINFLIPD